MVSISVLADPPIENARLAPVLAAWQNVRSAVVDAKLTHAQKSAAVDQLFAAITKACEDNGDGIIGDILKNIKTPKAIVPADTPARGMVFKGEDFDRALEELTKVLKEHGFGKEWDTIKDELKAAVDEAKVEAEAEAGATTTGVATNALVPAVDAASPPPAAAEEFVTKAKKFMSPERIKLAIEVLRQIVALEEQHIFTVLSDRDNRPRQIEAMAALATDFNFLVRQGLALGRLFQIAASAASKVSEKVGPIADLTAERAGEIKLVPVFDELFPKLVGSLDDLGLYYAKLVQSFSALIYHFSPEAYADLDQYMGMMPRKMSFQQVKEIVETDLGRPLDQAYTSFDVEPFANGSMAQLHWAKMIDRNGKEVSVAVKVQKEFVKQELDWNMKTNAIFFDFLEGLTPEQYRWMVRMVTDQAEALGDSFRGEIDSPAEARRQNYFRRVLKNVPHHKVPFVYMSHVGARTITVAAVCDAKRIHMVFETPKECVPQHPYAPRGSAGGAQAAKKAPVVEETQLDDAETKEAAQAPAAAAGATDDAADDTEQAASSDVPTMTFGKLMFKLANDYGYRLNPNYFQFMRTILPIVSVRMQFEKLQKQYVEAGMNGFDSEVQHLGQVAAAFDRAVFYQLIYMKELHADYNWGNVLVDPTFDVNLIDFAQTVSTRGLVMRPAVLIMAIMKGDPKLVLKKLSQMGAFRNLDQDSEKIISDIQAMMTTYKIVPTSWKGFVVDTFLSWKFDKKESKAKADRARQGIPPAPAATDTVVRPGDLSPSDAEAGIETAQSPEEQFANIKSNTISAVGSMVGRLMQMMVTYPYHRSRVLWLRSPLCERLLGDKQ